jgi:Protein of unknown function (DUF2795)
MAFALAAEAQVVLEGIPLPAQKQELVEYAQRQGADQRILGALRGLPDREYRYLDEVGERLASVQPKQHEEQKQPRAESGKPPGGDDYTQIPTDTGRVQPD